eukprot:scaffold11317_cov15-Tisochrysis_lutea.AAC.1
MSNSNLPPQEYEPCLHRTSGRIQCASRDSQHSGFGACGHLLFEAHAFVQPFSCSSDEGLRPDAFCFNGQFSNEENGYTAATYFSKYAWIVRGIGSAAQNEPSAARTMSMR